MTAPFWPTISRVDASESELSVALHESAHAVASLALGFRTIVRMTMQLGTASWIGAVNFHPNTDAASNEADEVAVAGALVAHAGEQFDIAIRHDYSGALRGQTVNDQATANRNTVRFYKGSSARQSAMVAVLGPATAALVRLHEPTMRVLATDLVESPAVDEITLHALDGDRVRAIVGPFLTAESKNASQEFAGRLLAELIAIRDREES